MIANLYLFAWLLTKVAVMNGFLPGILLCCAWEHVRRERAERSGQLATTDERFNTSMLSPATSPLRKVRAA